MPSSDTCTIFHQPKTSGLVEFKHAFPKYGSKRTLGVLLWLAPSADYDLSVREEIDGFHLPMQDSEE